MKSINLFFFLTMLSFQSQAQNEYAFSEDILRQFNLDTNAHQFQHYAIELAEIGAYEQVLFMDESFVTGYENYNPRKVEVLPGFKKYQPANALNEITRMATNHRIVILNEAHFSAQNRIFTKLVLRSLSSIGFQHLFIEDLKHDINPKSLDALNERKYPLSDDGYYVTEPQYANLWRDAMQHGYSLHNYEFIPGEDCQDDPMKRWFARESGQANNILRFLQANPEAKIVIHCGYGHLGENLISDSLGMMGALLKKRSGIDPLTINQTFLLETHSEKTMNPYRKIINENPPTAFSVFLDEAGKAFSDQPENYDLVVYFPDTQMESGRPDWLRWDPELQSVELPSEALNQEFPIQIQAFLKSEKESNAIPMDIVEVINKADEKVLLLKPGAYRLAVVTKNSSTKFLNLTVE